MRKSLSVSLFALLALASAAIAQQGGWLIESSNVVSPSQPTTTVEVWAWFDTSRNTDAFAVGDFDFHADNGDFLNPQVLITALNGETNLGGVPGTARGNLVTDVRVFQLFGGILGSPDTSNPILVWSVDWTTTDFTPRSVSLSTQRTSDFRIGNAATGGRSQWYPQQFVPGTGVIEVVPSPASAVPMVVVGAVMLRRRRPR